MKGGDFFMAGINLNIISKLIQAVLTSISPDIKDALKETILKLETKAKSTKNPFDDLLVELLKLVLL